MAAFTSPSAGLAAAVAMQQAVDLENRRVEDQTGLRVGLSTGEVRCEEDDDFGAPVVEAARLCGRCEGGQILCSALVKAMGGRRATQSFSSLGELAAERAARAGADVGGPLGTPPDRGAP